MLHLVVAAELDPDHHAEEFTVHGSGSTTTVAETLAEARTWRAEREMRAI
jgi:hypothetical protein